jgi:hypothetical protein
VRCPSPIGCSKIHLLPCKREVGHKLDFCYAFNIFLYKNDTHGETKIGRYSLFTICLLLSFDLVGLMSSQGPRMR